MHKPCCGALLVLVFVTTSHAQEFEAGAATADLTPSAGVSLDGPISKPGPVLGVHDPLTARALAVRSGDTCVILVIADMCLIDRDVYDAAKEIVSRRTGVPASHQLMAATHSHATPRVVRISTRPPDEAYRRLVSERIAEAATRAFRNLQPAEIGFGRFKRPDLLACRRLLCAEGTVAANPFGATDERVRSVAGRSQAVLRPAGPIDPQFSFISLRSVTGQPLAVLGNFSVHYCGGYARGQVSADYFGYFAGQLEEHFSSGSDAQPFVAIMSNATSGDTGSFQNPAGVNIPGGPWKRMEYFGHLLADATRQAIRQVEYQRPSIVLVAASDVKLRVRKPDAARLRWAKALLADSTDKGPHQWSRIYAAEAVHLADCPDAYPVFLQAIRIGDIAIAAAPCEVFAETGLAIKAASPLKNTICIELANGYSGYLPTRQQHEWGGYETWPARSSHLEVNAEATIRNELVRLLRTVAGLPE